ncbi:hypothetical protein K440DRAFT_101439 [Wilcoxina mikolae CBS 423.85]|nr:hypothetical protein K440DRAFT_101439 [Wilcoxina mikolae CBS 423.85]
MILCVFLLFGFSGVINLSSFPVFPGKLLNPIPALSVCLVFHYLLLSELAWVGGNRVVFFSFTGRVNKPQEQFFFLIFRRRNDIYGCAGSSWAGTCLYNGFRRIGGFGELGEGELYVA